MWRKPEWRLPRNPSWSVELLDRYDNPLRVLDTVSGGSISLNANEPLGGSGTLTLDNVDGIDFRNHRVRMIFDPDIAGVEAWPVATMRFASPGESRTHFGDRYTVKLLPKTQILQSASVSKWYSLPAGTNIVDAIVDLIEMTGETRIAVTPSDAVLVSATTFEDLSVRSVVNELAKAAGYWSIFTDGSGQFRVEPYVLPSDRPTVWELTEGEASLFLGDVGREHDFVPVPNVSRVFREGDDEHPGIEGVYVNVDPDDPDSVINKPEQAIWESAEVETQGEADALAYRRWADAQSPLVKISAGHEVIPVFPNDVIKYTVGGRSGRASVQKQDYTLTFDGQVSAEWRGV